MFQYQCAMFLHFSLLLVYLWQHFNLSYYKRCEIEGTINQDTAHFLLTIVQRDAPQSSLFIILRVYSSCFGCQPHSSSGVRKTVTTTSGTGHIFCVQLPPSNVANLAVVTVLCTLDDGYGWHPKHVEWTFRIIYRLLCVASRLTIINALTPNVNYSWRTAPLTSKFAFYIFIQQI